MGMDTNSTDNIHGMRPAGLWTCYLLAALAAVVGLALLVDSLWRSSASYDEVLYLSDGARWWRTGFVEKISRAGSPLTFWKLQQAPALWLLDRLGFGAWIDDPARHEAARRLQSPPHRHPYCPVTRRTPTVRVATLSTASANDSATGPQFCR